jgi:hypothetical protein
LKSLVSLERIQYILNERFQDLEYGWKSQESIREEIKALMSIKKLIAGLDFYKNSPMAIKGAVYILGILKSEEAVEPLIGLLNYDSGRHWNIVINATAEALGRIGDLRAKYPLGRLLQNSDDRIRETAKRSLMQIGPSFYYDIQKERILSVLFAKDLEVLIQYLEGKSYDHELFKKVYDRLQKGHTFYELSEVVEKTGGLESWKKTLETMRKREITISEVPQQDLTSNQILNITYRIPEAHFRNHILLYEDFELRLDQFFDSLSKMKIEFLVESLPYRERSRERPFWADSDDDSWMYEQTLYEQMSDINSALRYILNTGFGNAVDAIFKYIENTRQDGIINLCLEIKDGSLVAYISDNGAGLDSVKLQQLSSGVKYESDKGKLSAEDLERVDEMVLEREREILVAYDLEKANIEFRRKESQVGGHGRGIHQSALLLGAYGGTMKIDTHNKDGQILVLTFGEHGLSGNINDDLELPVPVGVIGEGDRSSMGTTFIVKIPLKSPSSILPIQNLLSTSL